MLKTIRLLMFALAGALALAVALLFWARTSGLLGRTDPMGQGQLAGEPVELGAPFSLVDHTGASITQAALAEKPTAIFFGFTSCPEVCPTTMFDLNRWMDQADPSGEQVQAFFVTVDPERDIPENLNSYVTHFSQRITGITGEPEDVLALADAWAVYYERVPYSDNPADGYDMNHTASVFLLDADGVFRGTISYGEADATAVEKLRNIL